MNTIDRIIKETSASLAKNGYNPKVGRIHLEALELRNSQLKIPLIRELANLKRGN